MRFQNARPIIRLPALKPQYFDEAYRAGLTNHGYTESYA